MGIVDVLKMHRADFRWYNRYLEPPDPAFINNYWFGIPFDDNHGWEYLLEGRIGLTEPDELMYLLANGTFEILATAVAG